MVILFGDDQNCVEGVISCYSITAASVDCFPSPGISRGHHVSLRIN